VAVFTTQATIKIKIVRLIDCGIVIERSLVQLLVGVLSSQLGQLSLPSLRGR